MSENIREGKYQAKPTCCGLGKSTNGHAQFVIECAVEVPVEGGEPRVVLLRKYQTLTDQGLAYAEQDVLSCSGDVSGGIEKWTVDTTKSVTVVLENREYDGKTFTNLKSIFSNDRDGGYLIKKNQMFAAENPDEVLDLNARIAAVRAQRAQNAGQMHAGSNGGNNGAKPAAPKPPAVAVPPKAKVPF